MEARAGDRKRENCVRADGTPKVDLRDHPQPIVTVDDPEALYFVIALIHPIQEKRTVFVFLREKVEPLISSNRPTPTTG
jgi:hypothetical protein